MNRRPFLAVTLFAAACLLVTSPVNAKDWPGWRGEDRTDISDESGLLKSWPDGGPKKVWMFENAGKRLLWAGDCRWPTVHTRHP